jgi:hypothetical protein
MDLFKFLTDVRFLRNRKKNTPPEKEMARICVGFDGTEYSLVEKNTPDSGIRIGVRIQSGPYRGVIFTTSPKISFTEQEDGVCSMNFSFTVEKLPANLSKEVVKDKELRDTVGSIIQDIIQRDWTDPEEQQEYVDLSENRGSNPLGASE